MEEQHRRIRVLIADDEPKMANAVAGVIDADPMMEVIGTASDAESAVALARAEHPDVVILDVRMRGGGGRAAAAIRTRAPGSAVVALSAYEDRDTVFAMLQAGAVGYLVKGASGDEIRDAVRRAAGGESALSVGVTGDVIRELAGRLETERREVDRQRRQHRRIRSLLSDGGITVAFQPIVGLGDGRLFGLEALARFPSAPSRDPRSMFMEAGEVDLRTELELAAVRAAVTRIGDVPGGANLFVNISPETVCSQDFLDAADLPDSARRLVLEVTEHAPVYDYLRLNGVLRRLRGQGVRLAVDDAGSGFASFQHILRLAPDYIKLDMALIRDVDNDLARRALAAALITFASEIGATIIAEGIETEAEMATLRDLGVSYGQGYFLARPAPLPVLPRLRSVPDPAA